MRLIEKLRDIRDEILVSSRVDENLKILISSKLYSTIKNDALLSKIFEERSMFLFTTARAKETTSLQNNLIETLGNILKEIPDNLVLEFQKKENASFHRDPNTQTDHIRYFFDFKDHEGEDMGLFAVYEAMQRQESFRRFGDPEITMRDHKELSILVPTGQILDQYVRCKDFAKRLIQRTKLLILEPALIIRFDELFQKYDSLYSELTDKIFHTPNDLNIPSFEKIRTLIESARSIGGPTTFAIFGNSHWMDVGLEEIKRNAKQVIDDLIDEAEKNETSKNKKNEIQLSKKSGKEIKIKDEIISKTKRADKWEDIKIKFGSDGRSEIFIRDERIDEYHFDDLGFANNRIKNKMTPIGAYTTLEVMALNNGLYSTNLKESYTNIREIKRHLMALFPNAIGNIFKNFIGERQAQIQIKLIDKNLNRDNYIDNKADQRKSYLKDN